MIFLWTWYLEARYNPFSACGWGFAVYKKVSINNDSLKSINVLSNEMNELVVSYEKNALNIIEIIKFIGDQNIKLLDLSTDDGDLEDVFIRLTKN